MRDFKHDNGDEERKKDAALAEAHSKVFSESWLVNTSPIEIEKALQLRRIADALENIAETRMISELRIRADRIKDAAAMKNREDD